MTRNYVCVGGLDVENKMLVRILDINGFHDLKDECPYNIGDVWEIEYSRHQRRPLPHSEDICVVNKKKTGTLRQNVTIPEVLNKLNFNIYKGSIRNTFEGKLKSTGGGTYYISVDSVPTHSTCFWLSDREITRNDYNTKIRYRYNDEIRPWSYNLIYVGLEDNPVPIIPKDTLIRLSLANWWSSDGSENEKRCYLQLSGWY
jgi:hypothetical protein